MIDMVEELTIGELIDALTIVNAKIFACVDIVSMAPGELEKLMDLDEEASVKYLLAGVKAQKLNARRSALKNAIDRKLQGLEENDIKVLKQ